MKAATINRVRKVSLWVAIIGVKEVLPGREKFGKSIAFREEKKFDHESLTLLVYLVISGGRGGSGAATIIYLSVCCEVFAAIRLLL